MIKRLMLFVFVVCRILTYSQTIISEVPKENQLIRKGVYAITDVPGKLTIEEVLKSVDFIPVKEDVPNFGITPATVWLKIELINKTEIENYRIQISQPGLDEIDFYYYNKAGQLKCQNGGEYLPFKERQYFDPSYIYSVNLIKDSISVFFIRVKSRDNFQIPLLLGTSETIFTANKIKDFILGVFAGIMVVMFLYNTFIYITVKDRTYLYYIVYLASVILTQISIQGYTFQYLWPSWPVLAQWSPFIFSPIVGMASAYFMKVFLNTPYYCPKLDKGLKYFNWVYIFAFTLALLGIFNFSYLLITFCASSLSMYMMIAAFVVVKKGYKPARYFLIAWSVFLFGVTIYAMTNLGLLPINNFTFYTMPFGAATEVVLLSLALADRINTLKKEKEESQAEALKVSQQNEKLIQEQNIVLEQKVHERTIELEETNEELNVTLNYLKDTQTQLVNAEKMASLGQLTAGIAHEINNPINFVSANLKPLKMDIMDVMSVVKKYEEANWAQGVESKLKEIENYKKEIDMEYLLKEINSLLNGIEDGAKRTAEIVSGLKNFSRLDESEIKEANINEGIESTLVLIRSSVPKNVDVVTNLAALPQIECYPGKLNQVFMNVITNAIYAMKLQSAESSNRLTITTYLEGDKVGVSFEDTGIGMTKEVKEKIFDPFFTTKDVGEGTGLGMSIVFKIVESHHAKIEVDSEPGVGTKIKLLLNKKLS